MCTYGYQVLALDMQREKTPGSKQTKNRYFIKYIYLFFVVDVSIMVVQKLHFQWVAFEMNMPPTVNQTLIELTKANMK